jgi:hypothetical protein
VVLAPTDTAFERAGFVLLLEEAMSSARTREIIEAHVAVLNAATRIDDGSEITTLSGQTFRLDDVELAQQCADNLIIPVHRFL